MIRHDFTQAFFMYDFTRNVLTRHDMFRANLAYDGTSRYIQTPSNKIYLLGGFKQRAKNVC